MSESQGVAETAVRVTRKGTILEEQSEQTAVSVPDIGAGPHAEIEVSVGETIGLPNYCSLRVDVSIRLPAKPANVEKIFVLAKTFALARLKAIRQELQEGQEPSPPKGGRR